MAEHQIETRILLRYDTYDNWMHSTVILKTGEAAIAAMPQEYSIIESNIRPENTPPAIGIKIGDGYHYFSELPWVQGVAADVYNWAKSQTKPSYNANEIIGLTTLIQEYINNISGDVTVEARSYRLQKGTDANINKYFLQSKGANDTDWVTDELNYIDLNEFADVIAWLGSGPSDYWSLSTYVNTKINDKLATLNYTDNINNNQVVIGVDQTDGLISVTRSPLYASNINGVIDVAHGGTGRQVFEYDEVLIGNGSESLTSKPIDTTLTNNNHLATNKAIINYITNATAGITSAMHYRGEATVEIVNNSAVNPQINGYNFSQAEPGDVIVYNYKEFVWTGGNWRLLGDEGSYIIKGTVSNNDILDNADIAQSKISNLITDLSNKVDKEEGKSLSSNDYTDEEQQKLADIEEGAQRNLIEHLYVNGLEVTPSVIDGNQNSIAIRLSSLTPEEEEKLRGIEQNAQVNVIEHFFLNENEIIPKTYKGLTKSVQLELIEYTEQEQQKLAGIQTGAQVNTIQSISVNGATISPTQEKTVDIIIPDHAEHANKIEKIYLNGVEQVPDQDKYVNIQIDESAVSFTVLKGARVPTGIPATPYEDIDLDETTKKLEFAKIAKTGWVYDIVNTPASNTTDYLILRCGDSTTLID